MFTESYKKRIMFMAGIDESVSSNYNLFLDDKLLPKFKRSYEGDGSVYDILNWTIATNYDEFCNLINSKGIPELISFDFQLGSGKSGLDCAIFLKAKCEELNVPIPPYRVHSGYPGIIMKFVEILNITN